MRSLKKYANGRFFDTDLKRYVTQKQIEEMIEQGEEFSVVMAKTGEDITESTVAKFKAEKDITPEKNDDETGTEDKTDTTDESGKADEQAAENEETPVSEATSEDEKPGEKKPAEDDEKEAGRFPESFMDLLEKGRGTFVDYAEKSLKLMQSGFTMADEEIDKMIKRFVKDKDLSESEGFRLKKDIMDYAGRWKSRIGDQVEKGVNEALDRMNLATREEVETLTDKIEQLLSKVEELEKERAEKKSG